MDIKTFFMDSLFNKGLYASVWGILNYVTLKKYLYTLYIEIYRT